MGTPVDLRVERRAVPIERDIVVVTGPEARPFLQGQLSQDLDPLGVGRSAWSLLLQPTGKVDAWLRVTRTEEEAFVLDVDAGHGDAVEARLRRFRLRTKADLHQATWRGWALRGPAIEERESVSPEVLALPAAWPGVAGVDLIGPDVERPVALEEADPEALEVLRIECGVPAMGTELTEATIPAEAGQWLIDESVSFTKGCYTGQELVARIDSRGGNVPRPLRGLVLDADDVAPGATVTVGGAAVGLTTSVGRSPVLGPVALAPLARSVEPGAAVEVEQGRATVAGEVTALPMR
jgi:folate-binding protein YgfZ